MSAGKGDPIEIDPDIRLGIGSAHDLPAFVELLEEAGRWLWDRGIRQWEPGSHRLQEPSIRAQIEAGTLLVARAGDVLVGGCVLTTRLDPIWEGRVASAAYLHKLVVARSCAGQGLGTRLVAASERSQTGEE